ncbi:MAG: hypothetical protein HYY96_07710 [Candidatus Tectomicrobia bacterium]|nr:hypothetical protein [Candidatus Tectomicrobia bacterium]
MRARGEPCYRAGDRVRVRECRRAAYVGERGTVTGVHPVAEAADASGAGRLEVYVLLDNGVKGKFLARQLEPLHLQLSLDELPGFSPP